MEKVIVNSGHGKNPIVIPEGEHHITKTDLSSNNDNRWPKGSPSERALRKLIVRSEVRHERKPEPSHWYHKRSKTNRETRMVEPKSSVSSSDRTGHERNMDTVEALKQQSSSWRRRTPGGQNTPVGRGLEVSLPEPYHQIVRLHRSKLPKKRKVRTKERKEEGVRAGGPGETGPNPPQWQDIHTKKEEDKKQYGRPFTKYHTLIFLKR